MAEYDKMQKKQESMAVANSESGSKQLKEFMDNRCTSSVLLTIQHTAPIVQRKKRRAGIEHGDTSYPIVADLYKELRPKAIDSSDAKTHPIHGASKEKYHSTPKSHEDALKNMYEQAKGKKIAEVDAELAALDVHEPSHQARIIQL